jgi:hypothetical protein
LQERIGKVDESGAGIGHDVLFAKVTALVDSVRLAAGAKSLRDTVPPPSS